MQCWQTFCLQQRTHGPEKGFWVASLVLNSVSIELGFGSIEHLLNNVSLVLEDFPVDGQPGQPPSPLHPSSLLPR